MGSKEEERRALQQSLANDSYYQRLTQVYYQRLAQVCPQSGSMSQDSNRYGERHTGYFQFEECTHQH